MRVFMRVFTIHCIVNTRMHTEALNLVLLSPLKCIVTLYTSTCNNPRVGDWLYKFASVLFLRLATCSSAEPCTTYMLHILATPLYFIMSMMQLHGFFMVLEVFSCFFLMDKMLVVRKSCMCPFYSRDSLPPSEIVLHA